MFIALMEIALLLLILLLPVLILPIKRRRAIYKVQIKDESRYMINENGELEEMKNAG